MFALTLKAELDGVSELLPIDTEETPFFYTFKVQCTSCREVHANPVTINRFEQSEIPGSRGEANFVWSCKQCKRRSTATLNGPPKPYAQEDPPTTQTIIDFDSRGLELVDFIPEGTWTAKGLDSGTKFAEVTLDEGEWYDFDDKAGAEVSIKDVKWEIRRA